MFSFLFKLSKKKKKKLIEFRSVLTLIIFNSVIMALTDYSVMNDNYEPIAKGSWRNRLGNETELIFVAAFTFEMVFKIIGMGFYNEKYPPSKKIPPHLSV